MLNLSLPSTLIIAATLMFGITLPAKATERTVGLLLLTPHNIRMTGVGITVFSNRYAETGRTEKKLEDAIYQLLSKELALEPGTSVRRVTMPDEWIRDRGPKAYDEGSSMFPSKFIGLETDIALLTKECQCSDLVLVSDFRLLEYGGTNQSVRGPSIWGQVNGLASLVVPIRVIRINAANGEKVDATHMTLVSSRFTFQWPPGDEKVFALPPEVVDGAVAALSGREDSMRKWGVWGVREGLFKIGLRPSCTLPVFEATPRRGSRSDFVTPPTVAPGTDPKTCPVSF